MNSSSPQKEISTISKNSSFAGGNGYVVVCSATQSPTNNGQDQNPYKKVQVRYMECLKNHAAAIGGSATDGCGEFMPSGEGGTIEALKCSACNCHRNFHRKELDCGCPPSECHHSPVPVLNSNGGRALVLGHQNHLVASSHGYPPSTFISIGAAEPPLHHHHQVIMPYRSGSAASESDDKDDGGAGEIVARPLEKLKKRFRTKFTQEQKEKMLNFAEKAGWRIQKLEESVVQQFCQEIGIKRRVLKVWMHNNKHSLAKKNPISTS